MRFSGWGGYRKVTGKNLKINSSEAEMVLSGTEPLIYRGNGRSYGDAALQQIMLSTLECAEVIEFDQVNGIITCHSGVLLSDLLNIIVPAGWFLPVVPGTANISLGGAVAADVHGKNHQKVGCFSEFVRQFKLIMPNKTEHVCSVSENGELFRATCGGMGLTGYISEVSLQLQPLHSSYLIERKQIVNNLDDMFSLFKPDQHSYSVGWLDSSAPEYAVGRGIFITAEHCNDRDFSIPHNNVYRLPFSLPSGVVNNISLKWLSRLYFRIQNNVESRVHYSSFFFPLDSIENWNKAYGRKGFLQYQCIFPEDSAAAAIKELLIRLQQFKLVSFVTVIKRHGPENRNYLSFPCNGYSIAFDFPCNQRLIRYLPLLDSIVLKYFGRFYLAKDAHISAETFKLGYDPEKLAKFKKVRCEYALTEKIRSGLSDRLSL